MTAWDFLDEAFKGLINAPGFADALLRLLFITITILILIEISPAKAKPLSNMARKLGRAINADIIDRMVKLEHKAAKEEKDNVRLQLLVLFSDYPQNVSEILEVAHHYFVDLSGDWYMTNMFNNWLTNNNVGQPEWFDPAK